MKLPSHLLPIVPLVASLMTAQAATHAVLPGTSIQAKINLAVAGDIVAIFGGTYNEDITINKAIRLVEVSGQQVTLNGNVTFSGVTACPPFEGFTVGSSGRGITVTNTTGLRLSNLQMPDGAFVSIDSSSVQIRDCQLDELQTHSTAELEVQNCQFTGGMTLGGAKSELVNSSTQRIHQTAGSLVASNVTITWQNSTDWGIHTEPQATKTVLYRVTTNDSEVRINSNRAWVGYSKIKGSLWLGWWGGSNAKWVVVGTEVDRLNNTERSGVLIDSRKGAALVVNCDIHNIRGWSDDGEADNAIEVVHPTHPVVIQNNRLEHVWEAYEPAAIQVRESGDYTKVFIRSNYIVNGHGRAVRAGFGATIEGNVLRGWNDRSFYIDNGAVAPAGANRKIAWEADPGFAEGTVYELTPESLLRDAGIADARYKDRDGSRNDAGPSGGSWYDPDGWTTENPVVISFDLSPDLVLEGVDTEVILSEGQAVSAP